MSDPCGYDPEWWKAPKAASIERKRRQTKSDALAKPGDTFLMNDVKQRAKSKKVSLAHSTPCFEYWLLLHLQDTTRGDLANGDAAKKAVKKELGRDYSTNEETAREVLPGFMPFWPEAARRAGRVRRYHTDAPPPDPANPSTEADQLVLALNDAAPEYARKPV